MTLDLVSVGACITDIALWSDFNALFAEWLGEHRPARAVVPVPLLHYGLQIEVVAVPKHSPSASSAT